MFNARIRAAFFALMLVVGMPAEGIDYPDAEHTPGYRLTQEAARSLENGFYYDARHKFQEAARWADKVAQFNLGVMYYQGLGIDRDPALAWAWFALAAERDYPHMVEMRNALWAELDTAQRTQAERHLEALRPEYGDEAAIPRTRAFMERKRRETTGSRTGFTGFLKVVDPSGRVRDGESYYRDEAWDLDAIIAAEKAMFERWARGRVVVHDLELVEDGEESGPSSQDGQEARPEHSTADDPR
ncbi:MAG: hypothetical protein Kow0020_12690 [Wenzhouxiangellaceae bacterium]